MIESALVDLIVKHICYKNAFFNKNSLAYKFNNPGLIQIYNNRKRNEYGLIEFETRKEGLKILKNRIITAIEIGRSFEEICNSKIITKAVLLELEERGIYVKQITVVKDMLKNVQFYRTANRVHK